MVGGLENFTWECVPHVKADAQCVVWTLNILLHVQFTTKQTANQPPRIAGSVECTVCVLQIPNFDF